MESIRELKKICLKKHKKGVTKPHWWATLFARRVSIYITWLVVNYTSITANQVTILQLISSLLGLCLLCFASSKIAFAGALFLHLGYIFDNVDGEVARYRKSQSINGMFLDFVNHEVIIPMIFGCLAFHYYFSTNSILYFVLGVLIVMCCIRPISKARLTTIYYLMEKRHSPSYDISNYQKGASSVVSIGADSPQSHEGFKNVIRKARKVMAGFFMYPNDVIFVSILILADLITNKMIIGSYFLIFFTLYLCGDFILNIYVHLKNKVVERDFYNYIQACLEIEEKLKR